MNDPQLILARAFELQRNQLFELAESLYAEALSLSPQTTDGWYYRGLNARAMLRDDLAIEYFKQCLLLGYKNNIHHLIGLSYIQLQRENDAITAIQKAIQEQPQDANLHLLIATIFLTQKRLEQAERHLQIALSIDARCFEAYRLLCKIKTVLPFDDLACKILTLTNTQDKNVYHLHYALAEIFNTANDLQKYWRHLTLANQLQLKHSQPGMTQTLAQFQRIKSAFNQPVKSKIEAIKSVATTPVFIVGLPRSGTTLVEQLLASHPDICAGDELPFMRGVVARLLSQKTKKPFPLAIEDVDANALQSIAEEYLSRCARLAQGKSFITDKNPENFFMIGIIASLFPDARIIRIKRNKMDVCFSLYNQCLSYATPYFNDLEAMADFVLAYEDLMEHWDQICSKQIFDIQYEDLVKNPKQIAPALFQHCGLKWHDDFLNFHSGETTVRSLTSLQVRKPIHRESIGSWKRFSDELKPLFDKFH